MLYGNWGYNIDKKVIDMKNQTDKQIKELSKY